MSACVSVLIIAGATHRACCDFFLSLPSSIDSCLNMWWEKTFFSSFTTFTPAPMARPWRYKTIKDKRWCCAPNTKYLICPFSCLLKIFLLCCFCFSSCVVLHLVIVGDREMGCSDLPTIKWIFQTLPIFPTPHSLCLLVCHQRFSKPCAHLCLVQFHPNKDNFVNKTRTENP